jgi:hypothetical protein
MRWRGDEHGGETLGGEVPVRRRCFGLTKKAKSGGELRGGGELRKAKEGKKVN